MKPPQVCFVELLSDDGRKTRFQLEHGRTILGRHHSSTIQIGNEDRHVSNRHAAIVLDDSGVVIDDLGSRNGIFINNEKISTAPLKHNDVIRFGAHGPELRIVVETRNFEEAAALPPSSENQIQEKPQEVHADFNPLKSEQKIPDHDDLFDISPEENGVQPDTDLSVSQFQGEKKENKSDPSPIKFDSKIAAYDDLFDVSPSQESIELNAPLSGINCTVEIKKRFQKQIANTQDIQLVVKNQKMREKILDDKNVSEPQKHLIAKVTKAYSAMRRTFFVFFGVVTAILLGCAIWLGYGYFGYKNASFKVFFLKSQLASYDDTLRTLVKQNGNSSEIKNLYDKLSKVQSQYDSIKATLELKNGQKIYSDTVEMFLDEIMNEFNEKDYYIPQHMLDRVKFYINRFTSEQRNYTEVLFRRRNFFFPEIERVFMQHNVPKILGYVAMQESLLDSAARSQVNAVGLWQFMENTGRRFNLTITPTLDERLNWRQETFAAANYFRSLLSLFGDGRGALLAIAAYNAGEHKIAQALENVANPIKDRDFWYLYRTSPILAEETREYVPQVLARIIIDKHPKLYGFQVSP